VIGRFPAIMKELTYLSQKVRIIAFLEHIFQLGKDDRTISFRDIAQVCQVDGLDVELLVMKAMSLELVKGSIDEAAETVNITWITPRYLSKEHLSLLIGRMKEWEQKMEQVISLVENQASELLTE
jgi:26S proteasome regulatory subunit N9